MQIAAIWILPILIFLPAWLEKVNFETGIGHEDGRECYEKKNGTRVHVTQTQFNIFVVTDIMVLIIILSSCCILMWRFRKDVAKKMDYHKKDSKFCGEYYDIARKGAKNLNRAMAVFCIAYVVLRLPWMIFGDADAEHFDYGYQICHILYIIKYSEVLLFGFANEMFRRAYLDIFKFLFPCCFKR